MRPLIISLIGLPGAGKTTLCRSLAKHLGWRSFVLGDALRARAANDAVLKDILDRGDLAPESAAIELVKEAVRDSVGQGLVLDGFPRHREQVYLANKLFHPWVVFHLDVDNKTAIHRLAIRLHCPDCGWVGAQPQAVFDTCPICGGHNLRKRAEDEPAILSNRLTQAASMLNEMIQCLSDVTLIRLDASVSTEKLLQRSISHLAEYTYD